MSNTLTQYIDVLEGFKNDANFPAILLKSDERVFRIKIRFISRLDSLRTFLVELI